jgi:very-short-patch-repair endonuclease
MLTKHSLGRQAKGHNYNLIKGFAKKMRENPTEGETAFYKWLKKVYLGHISTQHHFVGRRNAFILDFYLPEKKIGFEIDGWHHYNDSKQVAKDKFRDNYCRVHGIIIVRLKNHEAKDQKISQLIILKAIGASPELIKLAKTEQIAPKTRLRKRR